MAPSGHGAGVTRFSGNQVADFLAEPQEDAGLGLKNRDENALNMGFIIGTLLKVFIRGS